MNTGITSTHTARGFSILYRVLARKQSILCSALRHKGLPYITLCYIDSRFFSAPRKIMHGSIRLPPHSLASSRGCSLGINRHSLTPFVHPIG